MTERVFDMVKKKKVSGLKGLIRGAEGFLEILLLAVLYYFVWRHGYSEEIFPRFYNMGKYVLAGVYGLLIIVLFFGLDCYKFGYLRISDVLVSQTIALFIANFITYWQLCLIANQLISPVPMLVLLVLGVAVAMACTIFFSWTYHKIYMSKKMLMVFGSRESVALKFKMDTRPDKYRIEKLIPAEVGLQKICEELPNFDAVVLSDLSAELRNDILKFCYQNSIRAYLAPKLTDIILRGASNISLFDTPLLLVRDGGLTPIQRFMKRAMDLILCAIAMIVAAPVMLVVALAIKLEDRGPVFYKQKRATLDGKVFEILKFRSMIVDAEKEGFSIPATGRDPRITKVGRIIRATRVDELPQILNIIKGDMSIVGPRPERVEHMEKYGKEVPEFILRTKVKGGLTGYAQIYGKYNTSPYDKLRLDLMYIQNYSLMLDIKLILMTVRIMLKKESTEGFEKLSEQAQQTEEILHQMEEKKEREEVLSGK